MTAGPPDRLGSPAPLILHLLSAAEVFESGARLAPLADAPRFPWATRPTPAERRLAAEVARAPGMDMALALRSEGAARLAALTRGLRLYQASPVFRTLADPPTLWRRGSARLLDFGPAGGRPVVVAPSLINRHHILDLDGDLSLMRFLAARGVRPLLLDWGAPGVEEQGFNLADYVEQRLSPAFDAARAVAGGPLGLVGYCMGGALAVALAGARQDDVTRLALIGAPWDFSHMTPMRGALASLGISGERTALARVMDRVTATFGAIPVIVLEAVFAQLDPGLAARKFRRFAALDQSGPEARRFVLIEDWLNAGPPLSGPAARDALIDWHLENTPARGLWRVGGAPVRAESVRAPTLVAAARRDRITPPAATGAIAAALPDAQVIRPDSGHVGMIVGRNARAALWEPLADFLLA
ncbi:alpha/beta fold hydrolase [Pikeienuella sp. HZG-20]|uniref:alpha/beta fold hydrolase n=1 Tax=Paludibacillus litoralis TaxID=3133267 RepID=UPI0030EE0595